MKQLRAWVAENRLLALSLGVSAAVAVVGLVVALVLGSWLTGTGPDEETGSTTIRNLGFVIAGLIALPLAVWRAQVADQQAEAAREQAEAAQQQAETAQLTLLNEHYQRGAELLGSDVLSECLAGIDALRRLAEEHPREYHVRIVTLLCTFVRHPGKADPGFDWFVINGDPAPSPRPREYELRRDVQAALDVISACHGWQARLGESYDFRLDLHGADLRGASLPDAHLSRALLEGVKLVSGRLDRGNLRLAKLNEADLTDANLTDADLTDAWLVSAILASADLTGADLTGALLGGADLTDADLSDAKMGGASLMGANLSGTRFTLRPKWPYGSEALGLTQTQLDQALADPHNPPWLEGITDPETGEQLVPPPNGERWERYQRSKKDSDD